MTLPHIIYSDHAVAEMRKAEPRIGRADVRQVLAVAHRTPATGQRATGEVRWDKRAVVPRHELVLVVIYLQRPREVEIVTVYWEGRYDE